MKKRYAAFLVGLLSLSTSCQSFLDVNTNPNAPQTVSANLYLAPMLHWMVSSPQWDGRYVSKYTQQFYQPGTSFNVWDRMGYDAGLDNGGQQWRDVYWSLGQNLIDMMDKAEAEQRWDLLGVGYILKAWGWQVLTDLHGDIIIKEAFDPSKYSFAYDNQEFAYQEVQRLLNEAITNLQRTDGRVDQAYLAKGDKIYNGDRTKWLKLAYGMLALNLNHYTNKTSLYKPADVIAAVDKSFTGNGDDALLAFPGTSADNADFNFLGRRRNNFTNFRQTKFVVGLMDGTEFGGVVDPRMSRMLSPAPDGQYRGLDVNVLSYGGLPTNQQPNNPYGYPGTGGLGEPGRYVFEDKARVPVMTYAQLQFIKAEAAYKMGNKPLALEAYKNGITAHFAYVNKLIGDNGQTTPQISAADRDAFLAATAIVPSTPDGLTLTHIMSQKYIAQWGWGHNELWMDMRRYHYTDMDPASGKQVFPGFAPPTNLFGDNSNKVVQRIRPRYNSEYVWNRPSLDKIHGLDADYHTIELWITQP